MEPLRLVIHYEDDTWGFLCGTRWMTPATSQTIHTDEVFAQFGTDLKPLRSLALGYLAGRDGRGDEWRVEPYVVAGLTGITG